MSLRNYIANVNVKVDVIAKFAPEIELYRTILEKTSMVNAPSDTFETFVTLVKKFFLIIDSSKPKGK